MRMIFALLLLLLPGAASANPMLVGGTVKDQCAPWGGPAFNISLTNGINASVYKDLSGLGAEGHYPYKYDTEMTQSMETGGLNIYSCNKKGKCDQRKGNISIIGITPEGVSGKLIVENEIHTFYVKREAVSGMLCGQGK